jgi:predicted amino acid racemase
MSEYNKQMQRCKYIQLLYVTTFVCFKNVCFSATLFHVFVAVVVQSY